MSKLSSLVAGVTDFLTGLWFNRSQSKLTSCRRAQYFFSLIFLRPLSWIYRLIGKTRQVFYRLIAQKQKIPVIVIGNITLGGTGKTPLLMAIAENFKKRGLNIAVVSRGYKGRGPFPCVLSDLNQNLSGEALVLKARQAGDEPVLIALKTGVPVAVHPSRPKAIQALLALARENSAPLDLILSDDGLQHYAMDRQVEVVVVDGEREFGNGFCLPAGPLREPLKRLNRVDFVVVNGKSSLSISKNQDRSNLFEMHFEPEFLTQLKTGERLSPEAFKARFAQAEVHAVCGLGNPDRFFRMLGEILGDQGGSPALHAFPDHHEYSFQDFDFINNFLNKSQAQRLIGPVIILTEKDALKCADFSEDLRGLIWVLSIKIEVSTEFFEALLEKVSE